MIASLSFSVIERWPENVSFFVCPPMHMTHSAGIQSGICLTAVILTQVPCVLRPMHNMENI